MLKARTGRLPIPGDVAEFVKVRIERYRLALLNLDLAHLTDSILYPPITAIPRSIARRAGAG